jgi:signal transduction histidine kinase
MTYEDPGTQSVEGAGGRMISAARSRGTASRYGAAALFAVIAAAITWALAIPLAGLHFLLPLAAVCASGLSGGIGPGLLAAALSIASYPVLAHDTPSFWIAARYHPYRVLAFASTALLTATVTGSLRSAYRNRARLQALLREQLDLVLSFRDESHHQFLADAGRLLEDASDPEAMLKGVARLAASKLGNWSAVVLLDSSARPRVMAVETSDPDKVDVARDLLETARNLGGPSDSSHKPDRYPIDLMASHGLGRVLHTGKAELLSEVRDAAGDEAAVARAELLFGVGVESFMGIPMRARGRLVGAIGCGVAGSGRRFDEHDLAVGEELARRCALAVDNAELCRAAQEGERVREEALAIVSHDLRGPLANILMASKTLEQLVRKLAPGGPLSDVAQSSSRVVIRCATRMTRLVDDLQDFANIEAGQLSVVRAPHAPDSVVREAIEAFLPMAEDSGVHLTGAFAPGELAVECDRDRIIQVLSNLLSNAIYASPRGGTVTVSVAESEGQAVFSVVDAGPGIPPDELPNIFDRYRRGRSALYKGAGLGLAIAKKLVELHGGRIWAESTLGRGSAFHFRLPAVRQEASSDVLVVDDDADIRYALKTVLELEGYHVALAANGREAWEWLQSAPLPALILLDLMMPVMNGTEFLGLVRTDARLRSVPVVLVTAFGSLAQSVAARSQGLLGKPFDVEQVLGLASRYCSPRAPGPN